MSQDNQSCLSCSHLFQSQSCQPSVSIPASMIGLGQFQPSGSPEQTSYSSVPTHLEDSQEAANQIQRAACERSKHELHSGGPPAGLHDRLAGRGHQHSVPRLFGWLVLAARPSASSQKRAASSTSEVLQSMNGASHGPSCIPV